MDVLSMIDAARTSWATDRVSLAGAEQVAKVGTWRWSSDTGELRWSDNLFRLHGLEPGEVAPSRRVLLDVTHPDDVAALERWIEALTRTPLPAPIDFRVVLRTGEVRHLRTTVAAIDRSVMVGSIQDLTAERRAEREIACRVAVTSALAGWESFECGMETLLRELAAPIGARAGAAWLPDGDVLLPKVFWSDDVATFELEVVTRSLSLPRGVGLPGRVWESMTPTVELTARPECERRQPAGVAGVRALVALPVIHGDELLAVLELASTEELAPTARLELSLTAIGYEVGEFLAHRRGELAPPALTARELEVLQLAAQGSSSREIAETLRISPATVKTHLEHIYSKFGTRGRAAAVAHALRAGLIR
jgi:DNA-binding CsgD family transcriptional regulator